MQLSPFLQVLFSILICVAITCQASSATEPHPHDGKVKPFPPGDPHIFLTEEALNILKEGKPYKTQIQSGSSGRGVVVQDVHAPTDILWERILDFDHYAEMVPKTVNSSNYRQIRDLKDDHEIIYTHMQVGFPMLKLQFFIRHEYYPELNSLIWTLDYKKKSDLDDSCGYWYVIPHPDEPKEWSRVFYSVDVSLFDWVPKFIVNFMSKQALTEATGWVKKFSEFSNLPVVSDSEELERHEPEENGHKRARPRWFPGKSKEPSHEHESVDDTVATTETCDSDEDFSVIETEATNAQTRKDTVPIDMTRYVLVASVLGLVMYNIHLYFSQ
jgi:hypothetical protein